MPGLGLRHSGKDQQPHLQGTARLGPEWVGPLGCHDLHGAGRDETVADINSLALIGTHTRTHIPRMCCFRAFRACPAGRLCTRPLKCRTRAEHIFPVRATEKRRERETETEGDRDKARERQRERET